MKLVFVVPLPCTKEALSRKSNDWLAGNQDNVSEWDDMSIADCCFSELVLKNSN